MYIYFNHFLRPISSRDFSYTLTVTAKDGGDLTAECKLQIEVYKYEETVSITLMGELDGFNSEDFSLLVAEILGNDQVHVAKIFDNDDK